MDEIVFCHIHKRFPLSHVTAADPDSSDSSRLCPNERYISMHYASINLIPTHFFLSAPKAVFISIMIFSPLMKQVSNARTFYMRQLFPYQPEFRKRSHIKINLMKGLYVIQHS